MNINAAIRLLIVAVTVFLLVTQVNRIKAQFDKPAPPAATPEDIQLLREIRDLLKK